jgi:hypothetical protein
MNLHNRPSALSSAAILILLISLAADPRTACADEPETPNEMEEVTVYGEKSLLSLKRALIKSEDNAFAMFNSLNKEYQYDIRCYKKAPLGSHIKRRICFANYVHELNEEAASVWRGNKRGLKSGGPIENVTKMRMKKKNLREIMDALKLEHPELAEALNTYSEAKHRYVTATEEK